MNFDLSVQAVKFGPGLFLRVDCHVHCLGIVVFAGLVPGNYIPAVGASVIVKEFQMRMIGIVLITAAVKNAGVFNQVGIVLDGFPAIRLQRGFVALGTADHFMIICQ